MPENIDEEFYEAMRSIGGQRPAEIDPVASKALNADVVFRNENVILEVKTLMTDPSERSDHIDKVSAVYERWMGRPGVPIIFGQVSLSTADVPPEMGFELARTLADPIRTAVTKANRQIRDVKTSLNMPDAHGILVLCNAGATTLKPDLILHALHHALGHRHSSINSAIFLTHGVPVHVPNIPEPVEVFGFVSRENYAPLPEAFASKVQDAWMRHQSRKKPVKVYHGSDPRALYDASNVQLPKS